MAVVVVVAVAIVAVAVAAAVVIAVVAVVVVMAVAMAVVVVVALCLPVPRHWSERSAERVTHTDKGSADPPRGAPKSMYPLPPPLSKINHQRFPEKPSTSV